MNRSTTLRLAAIGAVLAALLLSGCGRKGPLDPPPGAAAAPQDTVTPSSERPQSNILHPQSEPRPAEAIGTKRPLPMDVLID